MEEDIHQSDPTAEERAESMKRLNRVFLVVQLLVLFLTTLLLLQSGSYGGTLFLIIPFSIGVTIGAYSRTQHTKRGLRQFGLVLLVLASFCILLVAVGAEGAICVLMAIGIICIPALLGTLIGYWMRRAVRGLSVVLIAVLTSSSATLDAYSDGAVRSVATRSVIISAPKERVWAVLTNPVRFLPPRHALLRAGVSYPTTMAVTRTAGGGAYLDCSYSNGHGRFPIGSLDSLRRLRFTMIEDLTTMSEVSWLNEVDAPHLKGYFEPFYGEFEIEELGPDRCRLTARTAYAYKIRPAFYWQWWTDHLTNAMHDNVLRTIREYAER
ncbi:SRPBCC family protein [Flaviaesturariibacter amylovorans]|uniref:SRPBCC family protein n=1 Tax=Flaviaesturariibacter amylovorans TaxID=1084520 RepID=A0ABP8G4G7_9BACT